MAQNERSLAASSLIMLHGFQEIVVKDYEEQARRRDSIEFKLPPRLASASDFVNKS